MRFLICLAGFVNAWFLVRGGMGLVGGGHGVVGPFLVSMVGAGLIALSVCALSRGDRTSLRNWLVLALVLDVLVAGMVVELGDWWQRAGDSLAIWTLLWFAWQPVLWIAWIMLRQANASPAPAQQRVNDPPPSSK